MTNQANSIENTGGPLKHTFWTLLVALLLAIYLFGNGNMGMVQPVLAPVVQALTLKAIA